jgi:hypothetical protein
VRGLQTPRKASTEVTPVQDVTAPGRRLATAAAARTARPIAARAARLP